MMRELQSWQTRRNKYLKWKNDHRLKNVKIGDRIDVRDTEYIWWTGWVEKILKSKYNWADLLYVHYDGWSRCYDEYIPADSDRVSPLSLYTGRVDIPKYTRHDGPDERVYGNVIEGSEARDNRNHNNANNAAADNDNNDNLQENNSNSNQEENNQQNEEERDEEDENEDALQLNLPTESRNNPPSSSTSKPAP